MLDVRRTNVEEARVVSSVFRQFRTDLMGAMQHAPPDLTGLETVTGNAASAAMGQAGGALDSLGAAAGEDLGQLADELGAGADLSGLGLDGSGGTTSQLGSAGVVGLYGSSVELRLDVSRLPRFDEYEALMMEDSSVGVVDVPSDVKTVTYFLASEESLVGSAPIGMTFGAAQASDTGIGRGLMRSQVARAVTAWNEQAGYEQSNYENARLLADEVVALQFAYFDGLEWLPDWDSDAMGGLPKAVEILLTIQPTYALSDVALARAEAGGAVVPEQTYRLVIHLPTSNLGAYLDSELEAGMTEEVLP
jgi:hypothetical protein